MRFAPAADRRGNGPAIGRHVRHARAGEKIPAGCRSAAVDQDFNKMEWWSQGETNPTHQY
jgi:hypothetical protein